MTVKNQNLYISLNFITKYSLKLNSTTTTINAQLIFDHFEDTVSMNTQTYIHTYESMYECTFTDTCMIHSK